ncbi:dihydropteroate synthase [Amphibacillus sediminis]|uniref:dihydropteroate synthase n=1 Tax=Amphibacillus sediminis TaxID=360185 RepID=UPI00082C99AE|nr:dihydropteroate synthase [Amphibacillus sediminis]
MNRIIRTKHGDLDLTQKTVVMGILNVTPDSFSDGGRYNNIENAVEQARKMVADGADIIDIGGESTRPGYTPIDGEEELSRVLPIIEKVREAVSVPISIDTFKARTAEAAIEAGADIINDIWGAQYQPEIAKVAADKQVPIILMHNRQEHKYNNLIDDIKTDLLKSVNIAIKQGVKKEQIILDPGIGFAKSANENLAVIQSLNQLRLDYPVLLGASRKSLIGKILDLPIDQRDEATGAITAYSITKGVADIVRVHNVALNVRIARMTDVLVGKGDN